MISKAWFKKLGFRVTAKVDKVAPAKGFALTARAALATQDVGVFWRNNVK
jgi:hypothetical protein